MASATMTTSLKNYAFMTLHGMKAPMMMVLAQVGLAGVNVFYKLASLDGMNLRILIAYRFLFAVAFISPLAYFLERKSRPKLTWTILGQAFLCGLFGGSLAQNLYLESLALTSATFASAMANLVPAFTFILAVFFRLEKLGINSMAGRAKVLGTILGIVGAMVLTFYKGFEINLWPTLIDARRFTHMAVSSHPQDGNPVLGSLLSIACTLSYATWLIIQAKMSKNYPCYYSSTALMNIMGAIQALVYALIADHDWEHWKLGWNIRLLTVAFTGVVGSGICITLFSWCVKLKGPLYVSVFSPLLLILVAIAGSLILDERLHLGSVLGAVIIVVGLYAVLWGMSKELKRLNKLAPTTTPMKITDQPANDTSTTTTNRDSKKDEDESEKGRESSIPPQDGNVVIEIEPLNKEIVGGLARQLI
ncbi:hypothetical protein V2J09_013811 [Rumex salicifolius]